MEHPSAARAKSLVCSSPLKHAMLGSSNMASGAFRFVLHRKGTSMLVRIVMYSAMPRTPLRSRRDPG